MRIAGWIVLVIGVMGFLGAALKGNSVFGPLFWIGLGAYLLHKANNREIDKIKKIEQVLTESSKSEETVIDAININKQKNSLELERVEDIQAQLTLQQREAAMCLISFFSAYNKTNAEPFILFKQAAFFFGIPDSPVVMSKIMSKYTDADILIDIVITIKPIKAKEFLLLTCYDLIQSSHNAEAQELLYNVAQDLGYNKSRFEQLIQLYK